MTSATLPAFVSVRNGPFAGVSKPVVRRWAQRMLRRLDLSRAELSVALTDDREIHELNRVFRRRNRPTDVLAFAMREGEPCGSSGARQPGACEMLGDIVVSIETARRQAARRRRSIESELRMLLAHGLLHLVGYDHRTGEEERVMKAKTRELCRAAVDEAVRRPRAPR
ncbi:MAG TPA: rRNA maturation RNase YbeY [Polyangiaceae bacterium]